MSKPRSSRWNIKYRCENDGVKGLRKVSAHRVEGWRQDYAFFGNYDDTALPTLLVPRELVSEVTWEGFIQDT